MIVHLDEFLRFVMVGIDKILKSLYVMIDVCNQKRWSFLSCCCH